MYEVGVKKEFIARHQLIGGDWGRENMPHGHHYGVEIVFVGPELDRHGYLLDIAVIERRLAEVIDRYRDQMLNELPEFRDLNPSLERFCDIFQARLMADLRLDGVERATLKLWEDASAWASKTTVRPQ